MFLGSGLELKDLRYQYSVNVIISTGKTIQNLKVLLFPLILAGCDVFKNIFTGLIGLKAGFWMYGAS